MATTIDGEISTCVNAAAGAYLGGEGFESRATTAA